LSLDNFKKEKDRNPIYLERGICKQTELKRNKESAQTGRIEEDNLKAI